MSFLIEMDEKRNIYEKKHIRNAFFCFNWSVDEIFVIMVKINPCQSMFNGSKISLWGTISHCYAPCGPVKVTNGQSSQNIIFYPMIKLGVKLSIIMNIFHRESFLNSKFRILFHLIIDRTLIKKVCNVIIHIVIRAVLIIDQYDLRLMENVKIVEIIMAKFNLFVFVLLIMDQKLRSELIDLFIFLLNFFNQLLE